MFQSMVAERRPELAAVDDLVSVSCIGSDIVVEPIGRLAVLGTRVATDIVNAATFADLTVAFHPSSRPRRCDSHGAVTDVRRDGRPAPAMPLGLGAMRVETESAVWFIDLQRSRFARSDGLVDRWLLGADAWVEFDAVWIAPRTVRALTTEGTYVTGVRPAIRSEGRPGGHDDRRARPSRLDRIA